MTESVQVSGKGWTVPFALFALHNLEEIAFDLPAWGKAHFAFLRDVQIGQPVFALAVAALMAGLILLAYRARCDRAGTIRLQRLFLSIVAAVFCWHIGISVWTRSLQPGTITAVLFLGPYLWLLRGLPKGLA